MPCFHCCFIFTQLEFLLQAEILFFLLQILFQYGILHIEYILKVRILNFILISDLFFTQYLNFLFYFWKIFGGFTILLNIHSEFQKNNLENPFKPLSTIQTFHYNKRKDTHKAKMQLAARLLKNGNSVRDTADLTELPTETVAELARTISSES